MTKNYWNPSNTILHTWFERDRANVRLESDIGGDIISLWDDEVEQFVVDGFKKSSENWHDALIKYANEHDLNAGE